MLLLLLPLTSPSVEKDGAWSSPQRSNPHMLQVEEASLLLLLLLSPTLLLAGGTIDRAINHSLCRYQSTLFFLAPSTTCPTPVFRATSAMGWTLASCTRASISPVRDVDWEQTKGYLDAVAQAKPWTTFP